MRRISLLVLLFAAAVTLAAQSSPPVSRNDILGVERRFDEMLTSPTQEDPFDLLGRTRGVYLDGFGVIFTTELSLVVTPGLSPFRPTITPQEAQKVRARKLKKLPELRRLMEEFLVLAASRLPALPQDEQIAVAVQLSYLSWEDRSGLPSQILLRARKSDLIGKTPGPALASVVRARDE